MLNNTRKILLITIVYLLLLILLKWQLKFSFSMMWFLIGGITGMYFLDMAKKYIHFSRALFQIVFPVVSFFVVTSSNSVFAAGLVLSMFLQMLLKQANIVLLVIFLLETFFFIR